MRKKTLRTINCSTEQKSLKLNWIKFQLVVYIFTRHEECVSVMLKNVDQMFKLKLKLLCVCCQKTLFDNVHFVRKYRLCGCFSELDNALLFIYISFLCFPEKQYKCIKVETNSIGRSLRSLVPFVQSTILFFNWKISFILVYRFIINFLLTNLNRNFMSMQRVDHSPHWPKHTQTSLLYLYKWISVITLGKKCQSKAYTWIHKFN